MAWKTMFRQNWPYLSIKIDPVRHRLGRQGTDETDQETDVDAVSLDGLRG